MKFSTIIILFFNSVTFGQKFYNLEIRPVDSRIIYINNRNIPNIELFDLTNNKEVKLYYHTPKDTVEVFEYMAKIKNGKYILTYENYYGGLVKDTFRISGINKRHIIYPDKLKIEKKNYLSNLDRDTIFIRNEFQATRYVRNYNFTITKDNNDIFLTTYFDRSYFPDTLSDKVLTLNSMAFVFDKPKKTITLNYEQKELVNDFLNELSRIKDGGNWSSSDLYLHNLNKTWTTIIDKKNYWLGATVLLRKLNLEVE